jgi:hypothetical protein
MNRLAGLAQTDQSTGLLPSLMAKEDRPALATRFPIGFPIGCCFPITTSGERNG